MKKLPLEPGCVAISMAGRDAGRTFVVLQELDEDFVLTVDGKLRTMERPKKKRRKHLKPTGKVLVKMQEALKAQTAIEDHELRAWLQHEEG